MLRGTGAVSALALLERFAPAYAWADTRSASLGPQAGLPGATASENALNIEIARRFPVTQSGTYCAHSHSGGQELLGLYFPLIIDPVEPEPFQCDRDYVVMFSDWSFESPERIIAKLKKQGGHYNFQRPTMPDFVRDVRRNGFSATLKERWSWSKMRMDPIDFADVTGYTYTYLMNGLTPEANWTGLFRPGERVRLLVYPATSLRFTSALGGEAAR